MKSSTGGHIATYVISQRRSKTMVVGRLVAAAWICAGWLANAQTGGTVREFPVDRSVVQVDNEFSRLNPLFKQRAGVFYEAKYVGPSAMALIRDAQVEPEQMVGVMDSLRAFVYEYLDAMVRGNGTTSSADHAKCMARLDKRFEDLFPTKKQRALYRVWRDSEDNTLGFLMVDTAPSALGQRYGSPVSMMEPAACQQKVSPPLGREPARQPYPPEGQLLQLDLKQAEITGRLPAEQVRQSLSKLTVVPRDKWEHYSHVAGMDESGWLVLGQDCFRWTFRPGGLAWVTYPDGSTVYLLGNLVRDK
jgi:hypothetical protein